MEHEIFRVRSYRSNSDLGGGASNVWLPRGLRHSMTASEPSSCSSTGTVVPQVSRNPAEDNNMLLQPINTDQKSLPQHLQALFGAYGGGGGPEQNLNPQRNQSSQVSLSSRRSGSRSFETVINMGRKGNKWTTRENLNSDTMEDTEEEEKEKQESAYFPRKQAWQEEGGERARRHRREKSRNSSVATTSDDDKDVKKNSSTGNNPATTTSTMESAQIDRAKSFEYFPGESFPIQENSSSYEYLPGHLVHDRPGTVVSNYQNELDVSGVTSLSESTSYDGGERSRMIDPQMLDDDATNLAQELNAKSKELLQAHVKKTKHFYRRMKRYISYVSSPSMTTEDSRKKQEILDRLLNIMDSQEQQLTEERPFSVQLGRLETSESENNQGKMEGAVGVTQTDAGNRSSSAGTDDMADDTTKIVSSLKEITSRQSAASDTKAKEETDTAMKKKRIDQLKVLRKEIKKLEKLERMSLTGRTTDVSMSETDTSFASNSTMLSEKEVPAPPQSTRSRPRKVIEAKAEAAKVTVTKLPKGNVKPPPLKRPTSTTSMSTKSITKTIAGGPGGPPSVRTGRPPSSVSQKSTSTSKVKVSRVREFGQTYPTPREENVEVRRKSKSVQTNHTPRPIKIERRPPVAFYLPLENESAITIGKRVIRQKEGGEIGKENRSILANYVAGLDANAREIRSKRRDAEEDSTTSPPPSTSTRRLTLRDALAARRPDFVHAADERRYLLRRAKEQRLEQEELRRKWLEELALMRPEERELARPNYPKVRIQRVFNFRDMIAQTKRKYKELPEVKNKVYEAKRKSKGATNRIMKDMYKKRLQENVLRGRVSLVHHQHVVNI